jgi:hypothetical protein
MITLKKKKELPADFFGPHSSAIATKKNRTLRQSALPHPAGDATRFIAKLTKLTGR